MHLGFIKDASRFMASSRIFPWQKLYLQAAVSLLDHSIMISQTYVLRHISQFHFTHSVKDKTTILPQEFLDIQKRIPEGQTAILPGATGHRDKLL